MTYANTHNDPLDAQGRTHDASEHTNDTRDDDVITHTQVTVPTEVTVVMTHGELTRTLTLRCGDIRFVGDETPEDPIHRPGSPMQFNMQEVEIVREVILDRLTGEKTTSEGETHANKQRREYEERLRNRQSGRFSQQQYYYGW